MPKAWRDPRVPADVDCVLRPLLERRAAETPLEKCTLSVVSSDVTLMPKKPSSNKRTHGSPRWTGMARSRIDHGAAATARKPSRPT